MSTNIVNISEVIVNGIIFDPKQPAFQMDLPKLLESIPQLFQLLDERGIDYVIVGGIAMLVYVEGRNTQDIDLILPDDALEQLPELKVEDRNPEFARAMFGDLRVDALFTHNKLFSHVSSNHSEVRQFAEQELRCATVYGLLLLKLFALPSLYRQMQFDRVEIYERDVTMLIRDYEPDVEAAIEELATYVIESDLDELRNIVRDVQERIAKQRKRFGNREG